VDTFRIFGKLVTEQRCSLAEGGRNTVEGNYSITREHKKKNLTQHELNRDSPESRVQSPVQDPFQILYYAVQLC